MVAISVRIVHLGQGIFVDLSPTAVCHQECFVAVHVADTHDIRSFIVERALNKMTCKLERMHAHEGGGDAWRVARTRRSPCVQERRSYCSSYCQDKPKKHSSHKAQMSSAAG
jgi:hypothetical protein